MQTKCCAFGLPRVKKIKEQLIYSHMLKGKRVLIFDDDQDLLIIFRFLFEDKGWEVHTFDTCDQAVDNARELSPQLILMDNWIPTIGGIEATRRLKQEPLLQEIPVIYISANTNVRELSVQAGADAFMVKPFDFDPLHQLALRLTAEN
jgi:two-component system cell cycle response regulator DivK